MQFKHLSQNMQATDIAKLLLWILLSFRCYEFALHNMFLC